MTTTSSAGWAKTACILCECNCGLEVQVEGRALVKIRGDKDHPGSRGYTCEKPLRLARYQSSPGRIDTPMRRRADGTYEPISWETALDEIARRLAAVRDQHGGQTIAFYGGGGQGNHLGGAHGRSLMNGLGVQYYSNALAQEKVGESWIDSQLYGNHTSGDFEHAEVSVFVGKNPWQSHGIARARPVLKEMARDPERIMIVIDPRISETAAMADIHLQVRPGTDAWCLAALVGALVQEDLVDHAFLAEHTTGAAEVLAAFERVDVADHARRCGVDEGLIRTAARRIGAAGSVATYEDLGVQQAPNSTLVSYLQKMIWILSGSFAKPGGMHVHSWFVPIAGQWFAVDGPRRRPTRGASVRRAVGRRLLRSAAAPIGVSMAGAAGGRLRGAAATAAARTALATFFDDVAAELAGDLADRLSMQRGPDRTPVTGARIASGLMPAVSLTDEILTDHPDRFRALWIESSNPAHSLPDSKRFREAMAALELTVVIDVAMTETARCADYVLPASSQFEKLESSFFTLHFPHNTFQLRRPLMGALPGTKSEPEIYAEVIDRLGLVEDRVITQLRAAATVSPEAFGLALFSMVHRRPDLAGMVTFLLYRTLGAELPEGEEAAAAIWGMAQLTAISQPDAVARAGFTATGFAQGQELFEAIMARREGVTFTEDDYGDAWAYVQHDDGRMHLVIAELLDELALISASEPSYTSAEFPMTLSAGERRSFTANVIIRDPGWRRRDPAGALRVSPNDAVQHDLSDGDEVVITTDRGSATAVVEVSDMMQPGHISLPNGMGVIHPGEDGIDEVVGVALNELTSSDRRDKFFGSPWHKNVPARIEKVPATPQVST